MKNTGRRGFTLIELLVVIAIIAILAAILFPVFANAKQAGYRSACLSNCRQIASAMGMYADSNDDYFPITKDPPWIDTGENPSDWNYYMKQPWGRAYWAYTLQRYIKNWNVFICPAAPDNIHSSLVGYMLNPPDYKYTPSGIKGGQIHYGMNQLYASEEPPHNKASAARYPTKTALVADTYSAALFNDSRYDANKADLPEGMMRIKFANGPKLRTVIDRSKPYEGWRVRHGGPSVVFVDGHAAHVPANQIRFKRIAVNENGTMREKYVEHPIVNPDALPFAPGDELLP